MDINELHSAFAATFDADVNRRREAEIRLRQADQHVGFIGGCLDIVVEPGVAVGVRQAAAVYLKNKVARGWDPVNESHADRIDPDEKPVFRERLVPALVKVAPQVRQQLVMVLSTVVQTDYPHRWPELSGLTLRLLGQSDVAAVHAGLSCMVEITRYYRYTTGKNRQGLDELVAAAFPGVLAVGNSLVGEESAAAGDMLRDVLKVYKMATYHQLPVGLRTREAVAGWGALMLRAAAKPLPKEVQGLDPDEREMHPWAKCHKWSTANLLRLFQRYASSSANLSDKNSQYAEFRTLFVDEFVPEIIRVYFERIQQWAQGAVWLAPAMLYNVLGFLEICINSKQTWSLLKPHYETLVSHVVFPLLCPTDEDLELFEDEPTEYIHKRIDIYEESPTPDMAATNFLLTLVRKKKKTVFNSTLQFILGVVNEHAANIADLGLARRKEGALRMLGTISVIVLAKTSPVVDRMEGFLEQYVLPDFRSPHGFLRARACEFLNRFADMEFKNQAVVQAAYQGVTECLFDQHLPVQVEAALALQPLVRHEIVKTALSERIPQVMRHLLALGDQIDIDAISGVMEDFVEVFSDQLTPFAVELATQMRDQFIRIAQELVEKSNTGPDADAALYEDLGANDKTMAAVGILSTLTSLVMALDTAPEVMMKLDEVFYPIYVVVFEHDMSEFYAEVLGLIENQTFCVKAISPTMWEVLKLVHKSFEGSGADFLDEMLPCLENYVLYGAGELPQRQDMLALLYDVFDRIISDTSARLGANDRVVACVVAKRLMTALRSTGAVDQMVPQFLRIAITRLVTDRELLKNTHYCVNLLEIIVAALYYSPGPALAFLEAQSFTQQFFSLWFDKMDKFSRVEDKQLAALGLLAVITLPDDQIPDTLRSTLPQLTNGLVQVLGSLPAAIEKKDNLTKNFPTDDDLYDDFYGDDGDDGDWGEDDEVEGGDGASSAEYVDFLAEEAAKLNNPDVYGHLDYDDEDLEEDVFTETPLDKVNTFVVFKDAFTALSQSNPQRYQVVTSAFTDREKKIVEQTVELANKQ